MNYDEWKLAEPPNSKLKKCGFCDEDCEGEFCDSKCEKAYESDN